MADPVRQNFPDRLGEVIKRAAAKLAPEVGAQLLGLVSPQSLAIIAAFLVGWAAGHAFGVGELIDIIVVAAGVFSVGLAVFSGLDELFEFSRTAFEAKSDAELDVSAGHLAKAVAILGVTAVIAVLTKGATKNFPRGGRPFPAGAEPPRTPGISYSPTTIRDPAVPPEGGSTSFWGNVKLSTSGRASEQEVARLHEAVHQFLAPKFYVLRRFRVENRINSYFNSSLYRYIEEALAETIGKVGVYGFSNTFEGIRFPVKNGYVSVTKGGGYSPAMAGKGIRPEAASLVAAGVVQGFGFQVWFKSGTPSPNDEQSKPTAGPALRPTATGATAR